MQSPTILIYPLYPYQMSLDYLIATRLKEILVRRWTTSHKNKRSLILSFRIWIWEFWANHDDCDISKVTMQLVYRYDEDMSRTHTLDGIPTRQYKNKVNVIYEFLHWAHDAWHYGQVIRKSLKTITHTQFKELSKDEIARLKDRIENCSSSQLVRLRDMAMFRMMLYGWLRRCEIVELRQDWVDYTSKTLTFKKKWWWYRCVFVSDSLVLDYLKKWMRARCGFQSEFVFCSIGRSWGHQLKPDSVSEILKWYNELAWVTWCTPHCLRVTYQNMMRRCGASRRTSMSQMWHTYVKTSLMYDRTSIEDEREIVSKLESIYW